MRPDVYRRKVAEAMATSLRTGKPPRMPAGDMLFWSLYQQMGATRTYHGAGPHAISFAEIEVFCRLHRWPLDPRHIDIIRAIDEAWLVHAYTKADSDTPALSTPRRAAAQPISPAAFDVVFG